MGHYLSRAFLQRKESMSQATISEIINAPAKQVFEVISDYHKYPEFLSDVKRVSIIDTVNDRKLVEFEIQIIKTFRYQIWLTEKPFSEISWKFHTGDLFKENSGQWLLKELGDGKTQVEYNIAAKFGLFVPGMIEKKLIEVNLPSMMKSYKNRIESL
jgi:coenzyme Q-binding protein COQ10